MRRPNPISIPTAVRTYYMTMELRTKDISSLFGCSTKKALLLKRDAREYQESKGVKSYHPERVNTKTAYEVWGLDINELEKAFFKLKKMGVFEE